jgi:hypothetical protein
MRRNRWVLLKTGAGIPKWPYTCISCGALQSMSVARDFLTRLGTDATSSFWLPAYRSLPPHFSLVALGWLIIPISAHVHLPCRDS